MQWNISDNAHPWKPWLGFIRIVVTGIWVNGSVDVRWKISIRMKWGRFHACREAYGKDLRKKKPIMIIDHRQVATRSTYCTIPKNTRALRFPSWRSVLAVIHSIGPIPFTHQSIHLFASLHNNNRQWKRPVSNPRSNARWTSKSLLEWRRIRRLQ